MLTILTGAALGLVEACSATDDPCPSIANNYGAPGTGTSGTSGNGTSGADKQNSVPSLASASISGARVRGCSGARVLGCGVARLQHVDASSYRQAAERDARTARQ